MDARVRRLIDHERHRQEEKKACGEWAWTLANRGPTSEEKLPVLAEEFGEVATAVLTGDEDNLVEELIQVAACSIAWLESLLPTDQAKEGEGDG